MLASATGLAADLTAGQKSYLAALHSFDSGEYAEAAVLFRAALAEDPREAVGKFAASSGSLNRVDYFPHLYLGISLEKSKRAKEAIEELEESKRQGAVLTKPSLSRILETALRRLQPSSGLANPIAAATAIPPPTPAPAPAPAPALTPSSIVVTKAPTPRPTVVSISISAPVPTRTETKLISGKSPRAVRSGIAEGGRAGIRSFFDGDFDTAEKTLTPIAESLPVARLFLAYTYASQALIAGQSNGVLARNARVEYRRAQEQGAPRSTDSLVSPSVRRLLAAE